MGKFGKSCVVVLLCVLLLTGCGRAASAQDPTAYDAILEDVINAYPWSEQETASVPARPELSYLYRMHTDLAQIGFAEVDLDGNGQEELLLAPTDQGYLYDLYTLTDGTAVHLADSGERYRYYLREHGYMEQQWSGSAMTSGYDFYRLENGVLNFVERITFDAYYALEIGLISDLSAADEECCWFKSESDQFGDYRHITAAEARAAVEAYEKENALLQIVYTPLTEYERQ